MKSLTNAEKSNSAVYKIIANKKKIEIHSVLFKGFSSNFALITVSDITKRYLLEKS